MSPRALVRRPSPRLAEGLLTHLDRTPVDADLALRQWEGYVAALADEGWDITEVAAAEDCPDSAFVEDTVVVYGDLAVISRPGAVERRPETAGTEQTLAGLGYRIARIEEPGTLDGGDVLKHDGKVWVGLGGRTNQAGVDQLADLLSPLGARGGRRSGDQGAAPEVGRHRPARRHGRGFRATGGRRGGVGPVPAGAGGAGLARRAARWRDGPDVQRRAEVADSSSRSAGCGWSPSTSGSSRSSRAA